MEIHSSGEDYLEAVLILQERKGKVRSIDLAHFFGYSKASISHAVSILKDGGYLLMADDGQLILTEQGRQVAESTYEKHCFFRDKLIQAGVDPEVAEKEACQMEHVISDDSFIKLKNEIEAVEETAINPPEAK